MAHAQAPAAAAAPSGHGAPAPPAKPPRRSRWGDASGSAAASAAAEAAGEDEAGVEAEAAPPEKAKPNFGLTGVLKEDVATGTAVQGRDMKYAEPPDAALPSLRWRLHVFKAGEQLDKPLHIHKQSVFLFGKDPAVVDVLTAHPSCSRQHAALQFRLVETDDPTAPGGVRRAVKPYVMDLSSTNGTCLNGERVDDRRFIELRPMDTLRFGLSSREYVLLHDKMA